MTTQPQAPEQLQGNWLTQSQINSGPPQQMPPQVQQQVPQMPQGAGVVSGGLGGSGFVDPKSPPHRPPPGAAALPSGTGTPFTPGAWQRAHIAADALVPMDKQCDLFFQDIRFSVTDNKTKQEKVILDDVTGYVRPGEILAIMGPSGSGKTSLLDFLAGRLSSGKRSGQRLVNGQAINEDEFHHVSSYVMQEDLLLGTMTVRETYDFAANLKIRRTQAPRAEQVAARQKAYETIVEDLGLNSCLDSRIGTVFQKGLSGGQIRRVSIGIEVLDLPPLVFLDEPTSGLDSAAAFNVIEAAKRLAAQGMAVCCTIHQPSSEVFAMLDTLLLLSEGRTCYFGPANKVVDHFAMIGYPCPEFANPADFVMRLINTDFEGHGDIDKIVTAWKTGAGQQLGAVLDRERKEVGLTHAVMGADATTGHAVNIFKQFWYIFVRQNVDNIRNPGVFWIRMFMYVMLSVMIGTTYLDIGTSQGEVQDRFSMLFYINAFMVFMSIAVVPTFIQDRMVFQRERANGWYSPVAYVLSGAIACIPGLVLISITCSVIIYFLVGLNDTEGRFGHFFLTLFMSLYCAESLVLLISAIVPYYIIAMALGAGVYGMFMIGQGALIVPGNIPDWWIWDYYIAFHAYAFQNFMWTQFHHDGTWYPLFDCPNGICAFPDGRAVLEFYDMEDTKPWRNYVVIASMAVFYRLAFWAILHVFHRGKR